MNPTVVSVLANQDYILEIEFKNGEKRIFSMKPYLDYPVFRPVNDYKLFITARATMGFVSWNDDSDLSHDTLYLDSKIKATV